VQELAASKGKRFAVNADEAHSSQAGEAASKLKQVLSAEELADLSDGGEISAEDVPASQMASRAAERISGLCPLGLSHRRTPERLRVSGRSRRVP